MKKKITKVLMSVFVVCILAAAAFLSFGFDRVSPDKLTVSEQSENEPLTNMEIGEFMDCTISMDYLHESALVQEIYYPGAFFIKVNFAQFNLRAGDYVTVSNPEKTEVYTYYTDPTVEDSEQNSDYTFDSYGRFWSMSITGDTAVIELFTSSEQPEILEEEDFGLAVTRYTRGYSAEEIAEKNPRFESICGRDDTKNAACYKNSHPLLYKQAGAVAVLVGSSGSKFCTGWRIGPKNHLMTNNHCVSTMGSVTSTEAWFGYQYKDCNGGELEPITKVGGKELITTNSSLDFTLFTLRDNSALAGYGYLEADVRAPQVGEKMYILQHPQASVTKIGLESDQDSGGECVVGRVTDTRVYYMCDTQPGSSGSAVLSMNTNKVISLHNTGGCQNGSTRMDKIWPYISKYIDTTPPPHPSVPVNLSAQALSASSINITWNSSANAVSYKIYQALSENGPFTQAGTSGNPSYKAAGLIADTTYYYKVKASNSTGDSDFSALVSAKTKTGGSNTLQNGIPAESSLSGTGETEMWIIVVPEGTTLMNTTVTAAGADFDLYGKAGSEPTSSVYDWRGYTDGDENVDHPGPVSGKWYIMVKSYSGSGPYSITCTVKGGTNPDKPQISSFTLSPSSIKEGETASISWTTSFADTVTASGQWSGSKSASGSENTGSSLQPGTYTYTLTASNSEGSVSKSVTLTVNKQGGGCSAWQAGISYAIGDCVSYGGVSYLCLQAHTSLAGWTPAAVPALWQVK